MSLNKIIYFKNNSSKNYGYVITGRKLGKKQKQMVQTLHKK